MKKLLVVDLQWQFQDEGAVKYNKCLNFVKENMSKFDHTVQAEQGQYELCSSSPVL